jgi:DNA-binding NarL/FixJ family response regulator
MEVLTIAISRNRANMFSGICTIYGVTMDIIVVEDSESVRFHLVSLLEGNSDYRVVASLADAEETLSYLSGNCADVVILDLGLPGLSDEQAVTAIKQACPSIEIVAYTAREESDRIFAVLKAGAAGYILKSDQPDEIINALEEIRSGGAPMSPPIARRVLGEFQRLPDCEELHDIISPLSKRETEILEMLYKGLNAWQIAESLCISRHTIHSHIKKIYTKLQVNSRSQAIYEALRQKFLKRS